MILRRPGVTMKLEYKERRISLLEEVMEST